MIYVLLAAMVAAADALLKHRAEQKLEENKDIPACHHTILLTKYHNRDAVFNLAGAWRGAVHLLAVLLTVCIAVFFILTLGQKGNKALKTGLALLLGGAFSNTYDRMKHGYVVDYFRLNVPFAPLRRIIFNLSDFCILIGAMITALQMP